MKRIRWFTGDLRNSASQRFAPNVAALPTYLQSDGIREGHQTASLGCGQVETKDMLHVRPRNTFRQNCRPVGVPPVHRSLYHLC